MVFVASRSIEPPPSLDEIVQQSWQRKKDARRLAPSRLPPPEEGSAILTKWVESRWKEPTWQLRAGLWKRATRYARENGFEGDPATLIVRFLSALAAQENPPKMTTLKNYLSHLKSAAVMEGASEAEMAQLGQLQDILARQEQEPICHATAATKEEILQLAANLRCAGRFDAMTAVILCWRLAARVSDLLKLTKSELYFRRDSELLLDWKRSKCGNRYRSDRYSRLETWRGTYAHTRDWLQARLAMISPEEQVLQTTKEEMYDLLRQHNDAWSNHSLRRGALAHAVTLIVTTGIAAPSALSKVARHRSRGDATTGISDVTLRYLEGAGALPDALTMEVQQLAEAL